MDRTFQNHMRLDPSQGEVRAVDQQWAVTWAGSGPRITLDREYQRGDQSTRVK